MQISFINLLSSINLIILMNKIIVLNSPSNRQTRLQRTKYSSTKFYYLCKNNSAANSFNLKIIKSEGGRAIFSGVLKSHINILSEPLLS